MSHLGSGGQVSISPYNKTTGGYSKDTTSRYTLNFDGGDYMILPAYAGSKTYISMDVLMPAAGSDGVYMLSLSESDAAPALHIQIDGADPLLYIYGKTDNNTLFSFSTVDYTSYFGSYHRIRIDKSGLVLSLIIDDVVVENKTLPSALTLSKFDTNFIGCDQSSLKIVPNGTKIKNVHGMFTWDSFYTDDAHTVALTDGQNAATIYDHENSAYWSQTTAVSRPSVTITIG